VPAVTPIAIRDEDLARIRYDDQGLVPAVVQEHGSGDVLMMAWVSEATLRRSLEEGRTVFWSRSRQEEWRKGDTSGDRQFLRAAYYDCDGDTLLFVVEQEGVGACHTGHKTCFYRPFGVGGASDGSGGTSDTSDRTHVGSSSASNYVAPEPVDG